MGIRDRNIDWLRQSYVIGAERLGFTGGSSTLGAGAPPITEISSFGYAGLLSAAIDFQLPRVADYEHPIGVRVLWCPVATVATDDSITWSVTYDQCDVGEALTTPVDGTGTELSTAIAAQSPSATTTLALHRGNRGIIDADTFDADFRNGAIAWAVDVSAASGFSANEVSLLGLEIDYIPRLCMNPGEDQGALNADLSGA
jgi:hypothetical protein